MRLNLYIRNSAAIHAVPVDEPVIKLLCNDPDFGGAIPPMQLRRMSKVVRMGMWASLECLKDAAVEVPDAIIMGTGFGCLQDTEAFLTKLIQQDEQMLTPTSFIQSTHNTVAGQIALNRGCTGYNLTVSQQGYSFENAIVATQLYLAENPGHKALLGAVDELTLTSFHLLQRIGIYTTHLIDAQSLYARSGNGTIGGEGAAAFLISDERDGAVCRITELHLIESSTEAKARIPEILNSQEAVDEAWLGDNGEARTAGIYEALRNTIPEVPAHYFKGHSGDFPVAVALGLSKVVDSCKGRFILINHWCDSWSIISGECIDSAI